MKDRRKIADRRSNNISQEKAYSNNRRRHPDRRLNSIHAEWIPMEQAKSHPDTRNIFRRMAERILKRA